MLKLWSFHILALSLLETDRMRPLCFGVRTWTVSGRGHAHAHADAILGKKTWSSARDKVSRHSPIGVAPPNSTCKITPPSSDSYSPDLHYCSRRPSPSMRAQKKKKVRVRVCIYSSVHQRDLACPHQLNKTTVPCILLSQTFLGFVFKLPVRSSIIS